MASCEAASRSHKAVVDESHLALMSRRQCSLYTFTNGYDPIEHQLPRPCLSNYLVARPGLLSESIIDGSVVTLMAAADYPKTVTLPGARPRCSPAPIRARQSGRGGPG
jgi:hypothetical protein